MNKQYIKKLWLTSIAIIILIVTIFWYIKDNNSQTGYCTVILVSLNEIEVSRKTIAINEKSLYQILKDNFMIETEEKAFYGHYLLNIDNIKPISGKYFLAIYVNGEFSTKGISMTMPKDGDIFKIVVQVIK